MTALAAVILAAGGSTRLGQPKQLLDWGGRPLIYRAASTALQAGLSPVVVVVGAEEAAVRAAVGSLPVQVLTNWRWQQGMSTSLQVGLAALGPNVPAAVFLQCDQPLLNVELLEALVACWQAGEGQIVLPAHDGQYSTPVLFDRRFFPELAEASGDQGGRQVIRSHPDALATVAVDEPDRLADVDTLDAYQRLLARYAPPRPALERLTHLIIDMDGVLWQGKYPLPGLIPFFGWLRERAIGFVLATNNSSRTPAWYVDKLRAFGVEVDPAQVLNSSQAAAAYLAGVAPRGTRVFPMGEVGLRQALLDEGFELVDDLDQPADAVVVGWDRHMNWDKLAHATLLINAGARFIGTNPDTNYPTGDGFVPGNGAQLAALQTATGVRPVVCGKPEPFLYEQALRMMGAPRATTGVVGDRLDTDVLGAVRLGLPTILLLTGVSRRTDLERSPFRPDFVFDDLPDLLTAWQAAGNP